MLFGYLYFSVCDFAIRTYLGLPLFIVTHKESHCVKVDCVLREKCSNVILKEMVFFVVKMTKFQHL